MRYFLTICGTVLSAICITCASDEFSRKLAYEMSPGCLEQLNSTVCDEHRLLAVTATTSSDVLHVLVSLWGAPSVLLLRTAPGAHVTVNWPALVSAAPDGAVQVAGATVAAAYGVSLAQLIEFDDPADSADLYASHDVQMTDFAELLLGAGRLQPPANGSSSAVRLSVQSPPLNVSRLGTDGTVTFKFEMLNSERRSEELPHLQQTGNSAIVGVVLDKLSTNSGFNHSRFGVQLATVGSMPEDLVVTKSLDDEYTPGVFKLVSLLAADTLQTGYLQWRPVTYTSPDFSIEHSTTARHYNASHADAGAPPSPLLRGYFGARAPLTTACVTFGLAEDGWYKDSKYAAWSTTVGTGVPPKDKLSVMVILLLAVGLGVPAAALLVGGVWIAVRRLRPSADRRHLIADADD